MQCWGPMGVIVVLGVNAASQQILLRSGAWKSGLASEAITRVPGQLEQNGQVLRIPYNICFNLVYIRFLCVEN